MYRQLLHTADISPFDIIVLFFWQAQWACSIISAVLFLFHWVHTLTMVTFLNGSTCALPILYNNLQPILTSVTTSWCDIMCKTALNPPNEVRPSATEPTNMSICVDCTTCGEVQGEKMATSTGTLCSSVRPHPARSTVPKEMLEVNPSGVRTVKVERGREWKLQC